MSPARARMNRLFSSPHETIFLIHEADPQSGRVVIIVFAHVARSYVRPSPFQNKTNFKRKQCSLLAKLWVWPGGSLMTPVLFCFFLSSCLYLSTVNLWQQEKAFSQTQEGLMLIRELYRHKFTASKGKRFGHSMCSDYCFSLSFIMQKRKLLTTLFMFQIVSLRFSC